MTEKNGLTSKKRKAIAALIGGANVTEAAAKAGVKRQTVHGWMHERAFKAELKAAEAEALELLTAMQEEYGAEPMAVEDASSPAYRATVPVN